jgi:hypothetical protein
VLVMGNEMFDAVLGVVRDAVRRRSSRTMCSRRE